MSSTEFLCPRVNILINQKPFQSMEAIQSVSISQTEDAIGMFTLKFSEQSFYDARQTWLDRDRFQIFNIGNRVEIQMGYGKQLESLIIGEITALEPNFSQQAASLTVRGHDLRHRLLRGNKTRTFVKKTDSDICSEIAQERTITAKTEATSTRHDYVMQLNQTDLAFLMARAKKIGYEIGMDGETLYFRKRQNAMPKQLTLNPMIDDLSLSLRMNTLSQVSTVEVPGWNAKDKKSFVGRSRSASEGSIMGGSRTGVQESTREFGQSTQVVLDLPVSTQEEADLAAQAQLNTLALKYVSADGSCQGNPKLQVGVVLEIVGIGDRFSGLYYIVDVNHLFSR
jgi:uncharacterized protein